MKKVLALVVLIAVLCIGLTAFAESTITISEMDADGVLPDKTGSVKVIKDYFTLYFKSLETLKTQDFSEIFAENDQMLKVEKAIEYTVETNKLYDLKQINNKLSLEYISYETHLKNCIVKVKASGTCNYSTAPEAESGFGGLNYEFTINNNKITNIQTDDETIKKFDYIIEKFSDKGEPTGKTYEEQLNDVIKKGTADLKGKIESSEKAKFNDIDGHWAEKTIVKYHDAGIINGYPDGSFKPDGPITRAELAQILSAAFQLTEQEITFEDVAKDDWYYSIVAKAGRFIPNYPLPSRYDTNMPYHEISLRNENRFLPDVKAIRMHVAEALVEIKKERENIQTTGMEGMTIQQIHMQVSNWYKDDDLNNLYGMHGSIPVNVARMNEYAWLSHEMNIMIGDDGWFYPYSYMTRAELLTAIDRMLK